MAQRFSLADKVCIVTGAASGIGLESVKSFLLAGAAGVCLVDRSAEALAAATTQLPKEALDANKVITAVADVTDPAANAAFVSKTVEVFGKLDVLMASAGVPSIPTPLDETAIETFDQIMAVNVRGVFLGCQEAVKAMRASPSKGEGCAIVLVGSQMGLDGFPELSPYIASKFAVRGLMASLAPEISPIRINTLAPGPIDTPMSKKVTMSEEGVTNLLQRSNIKRLGRTTEMADAALYLASDASSYCSGTTLKADGGWSKWA